MAGELEASIAVLKTEVRNNLENVDRLNREMDQQGDRAQSVATQIADREQRLEEITRRRETLSAQLAEQERKAEQTRQSAGQVAGELEELRRREELQNASAGDARSLLSALAAAQQELLDRV